MAMMMHPNRIVRVILIANLLFGSLSIYGFKGVHAAPESGAVKVVNVNKADIEELQTVRGIGPLLAERIIQFRKENGPFEQLDDLADVRGIGSAKLQKIKGQIALK